LNTDALTYVLGLDLGKQRDPAALVVLACRTRAAYVVGLRRWLGVDYTRILDDVRALVTRPPFGEGSRPALVVDATGVGVAWTDFAKQADLAAMLVPVTITSGKAERRVDGVFRVPKHNLSEAVRTTLEARALTVAPGLKGAEDLRRELIAFERRLTAAGNEVSGAFGQNHDDLVMALSYAVWFRRRTVGLR
jgi:hypothetical protein